MMGAGGAVPRPDHTSVTEAGKALRGHPPNFGFGGTCLSYPSFPQGPLASAFPWAQRPSGLRAPKASEAGLSRVERDEAWAPLAETELRKP